MTRAINDCPKWPESKGESKNESKSESKGEIEKINKYLARVMEYKNYLYR